LGVTGFCQIWIPSYAKLAHPLFHLQQEAQQHSHSLLEWDKESQDSFLKLKQSLGSAPALSLPSQDTFQLYFYEKGGLPLGVITQLQGSTPQHVGYLSKELDNIAKEYPGCLRALAAVSMLIPEAQKFILGKPLTIYTPHDLGGILSSNGGLWLSDNQLLRYEAQLLDCLEVALKTCPNVNPASLLPTYRDVLSLSCEEVLVENYSPRPDLLDKPLPYPDLILFTDGSSSVNNREQQAEVAAVTPTQILWAEPLPPNTSAQLAKLIALTKALQLSQGKRVNIYTDSKYAFLNLHAHAAIWREWGMLTASGSPIKHS
jgi:hypothetical protein